MKKFPVVLSSHSEHMMAENMSTKIEEASIVKEFKGVTKVNLKQIRN